MQSKIYLDKGEPVMMDLPDSVLVKSQKQIFEKRVPGYDGHDKLFKVEIRYDDQCGNGHNSFSITGDHDGSSGCVHDEIEKHFPELAPFIKWHRTSSDGRMHYVTNALYHAERVKAGIPNRWEKRLKFDGFPMTFDIKKEFMAWLVEMKEANSYFEFEIYEVHRTEAQQKSCKLDPNYTILPFGGDDWYKAPFNNLREAEEFLAALQNHYFEIVKTVNGWTEEKIPNFDHARGSAVWPEAKEKDFTQEKLLARLPELMKSFKTDMELLGFVY